MLYFYILLYEFTPMNLSRSFQTNTLPKNVDSSYFVCLGGREGGPAYLEAGNQS